MTTNKKSKTPTKKDAKTLNVTVEEGKSKERKAAELLLSPPNLNAITAQTFVKPGVGIDVDLAEAIEVMREKTEKINAGDLSELETTLTAQVVSLNSIFNTLAIRSANNMGEYLKTMEVYMRLALKAQAQCARTIEVLATLKNPPIVYAKQANIAHGHQQVNNGSNPLTHAGKNKISQNELLNEANYATLDTRGKAETGRTNQEVATVETVNGGKDGGR